MKSRNCRLIVFSKPGHPDYQDERRLCAARSLSRSRPIGWTIASATLRSCGSGGARGAAHDRIRTASSNVIDAEQAIAIDGKQSSRADPAGDRFPRPAASRRAIGLATKRNLATERC